MIEAYEVGVSLVMSDSILESLSLVNSKFLETQQLVMGANAALRRMDSLTKTAASSANGLATAMGRVASAAKAAASSMAGMNATGGGGYPDQRAPRQRSGQVFTPYGLLTYNPPPMPVNPGNLPATIPGQSYYSGDNGQPNFYRSGYTPNFVPGGNNPRSASYGSNLPAVIPGAGPQGPESWPGYRIPDYGNAGTPYGPDSAPNGYTPNFTMGGEDAKMSNPEGAKPQSKSAKKAGSSYYGDGQGIFADATGAYFGYSFLKNVFGDTGQIDAVKANMLASGFTPAQVAAAYAEADKLRQQIPGTSNLDNMKELLFLKARFGSVQEAMNSLPDILKQGVVVTAASNGGIDFNQWFSSLNENLEAMARAGEISGKLVNPKTHQIDPTRLAAFTKNMADLALASGGVITPQDILALSQNAGPGVVSQLSDPALFGDLAPIILSMGGARAGTALNALAMQFKGGKMNQYNARAMHDIGLLPDYMFDKDGKLLKKYRYGIGMAEIPAGALPDQALYNKSPGAWLMQVLLPHLEAHGYTTVQEQQNYMYRLLSRTTGIRGMQDLITNLPQIEKYYAAQQAQQKQDNYQTIVANNPLLQADSLNAAVSAFMATSGQTWMPQAIKMINSMTDFMNAAGKLATKHPHITSAILDAVGGLTALAGVGFAMGVLHYALKPALLPFKAYRARKDRNPKEADSEKESDEQGKLRLKPRRGYKFSPKDYASEAAAGEDATELASAGEVAAASTELLVGIAAVTSGVAEFVAAVTIITGSVYALGKGMDWVDTKLDKWLGITGPLNPGPQKFDSAYTGTGGWDYTPPLGSLAPNAATPPPPQQAQQNGPIPVHVTNSGDIHNGTAKAMIHQLTGRMNGPTGFDYTTNGIAPAGAY